MQFELIAPYQASPGQVAAVEKIVKNFATKEKQTLLGITGSGKTFVMANVINRLQKPTLDSCAQQDFGCSTLRRIERAFSP